MIKPMFLNSLEKELFLPRPDNMDIADTAKAASKQFISTLARFDCASAEGECVVCQCNFADDKLMSVVSSGIELPCHHVFHTECIQQWFKTRNTCPLCRYELQLQLENDEEIIIDEQEAFVPTNSSMDEFVEVVHSVPNPPPPSLKSFAFLTPWQECVEYNEKICCHGVNSRLIHASFGLSIRKFAAARQKNKIK